MTQKKVRIPRISLRQVDRYLADCVRPIPDDPSMLEIQPEKVPPLFLPPLFPRGSDDLTADELRLITRDDWEEMCSYLREFADEFIWKAKQFALADRGPSALDQAPLADPWVPGRNSSGDLCLIGFRPCGRGGKRTKAFSAKLWAIDIDRGWALTGPHWYRLGQRISGPEFQALRPRYSNLQEFSDKEIEASLLVDRARIATKMSQLRPPTA